VAIITSGYHEGNLDGKIAAVNLTDGSKEAIWENAAVEMATQGRDADIYYTMTSPIAVDSDNDGLLDLIFAGDSRGTLWKFYYDYVDDAWKKVARFNTGGAPISARPDVVFDTGGKLRVYFGSGSYLTAGDKLDAGQNAFYCVVELKHQSADANNGHYVNTDTLSKTTDLVDVSTAITEDNYLDDGILTDSERTRVENKGWYFNLVPLQNPSERVTETSLVLGGVVYFTSFTPNQDICGFGGDAKLYAVDFRKGFGAKTRDGTMALQGQAADKRYIELKNVGGGGDEGSGIPSSPGFYFDRATGTASLIIQTSDTTVRQAGVNLEENPMKVLFWRSSD
jgi:type IV pilus assembly protein PilY1